MHRQRFTTKKQAPIVVVHDDREKEPWDASFLGEGFIVERRRLETGDYTVGGMEGIVCIEKKANWEEIAVDVSRKQYTHNLIRSLRRMQQFPVRILVVHDSIPDIRHTRIFNNHVTPTTIMNWTLNIVLEYGVMLYPVGPKDKSQYLIREMFRRIVEFNRTGRLHATSCRRPSE